MSLEATRWAWSQAMHPSAKLVLLALAECVNGKTGETVSWPGQDRLAAMRGISVRQVRRILRYFHY